MDGHTCPAGVSEPKNPPHTTGVEPESEPQPQAFFSQSSGPLISGLDREPFISKRGSPVRRVAFTWLAVSSLVLFAGARSAQAEDISGVIATTKVIYEDSRLVGDVTCTAADGPCIDFGASGITLRLNGFTMTGPGNPDATPDPANPGAFCNPTSGGLQADGIRISDLAQAQALTRSRVLGPGMVQKFRRHGIFIAGTTGIATKARVQELVSHHNCFSGIFLNTVSESVVEENASVRNGSNSTTAPCGGSCIVNSHNNRIRRNHFAGNGSVTNGNNDFGVGLIMSSSGNVIEENSIGGNTNGILIHAPAADNLIRRNVIAGNPPSQVSRTFGSAIGFDVKDESVVPGTGARNTFQGNLCITYFGPGPAVCPNFPRSGRGGDHRDDHDGDDRRDHDDRDHERRD
jgi:parallel beta-helix repeat protein